MSEGAISIKKAIPIIVITWILSLVSTLAITYFTPFIPIGTGQMSDSAVTADKILDGAVITTKLDDGSVTSAKILDGTLTAVDITDGSITTIKVADSAVTMEKIADEAVATSNIADNAIVTVKLADGSVTSAKVLDGTIAAADLATGATTSIKIADGAVTTGKLAEYAVTDIKLAAGAIPFNSTWDGDVYETTSTSWVDMPHMSLGLTLNRNSCVMIMLSCEAWLDYYSPNEYLVARALVNSTDAYPETGISLVAPDCRYAAHSYIFYLPNVSAGHYTVKIQWHTVYGGTVVIRDRTLIVLALPA
jgi:hypothetical protein